MSGLTGAGCIPAFAGVPPGLTWAADSVVIGEVECVLGKAKKGILGQRIPNTDGTE